MAELRTIQSEVMVTNTEISARFADIARQLGGDALFADVVAKDEPITLPEPDPSKREPNKDGEVPPLIVADPSK